jgi:hypothetical protein
MDAEKMPDNASKRTVTMRAWLAHLRSRKLHSIGLALAASLIAALFVFMMFKSGDFSVVPMAAALLASIFALAIILPPRIANYAYGLVFVVFGAYALARGQVLGNSREDRPLQYWLWTFFLFLCACVLLHAAYRDRNKPVWPEEPAGETDTRKNRTRRERRAKKRERQV